LDEKAFPDRAPVKEVADRIERARLRDRPGQHIMRGHDRPRPTGYYTSVLKRVAGRRQSKTLDQFFATVNLGFIDNYYAENALVFAQGAVYPTIPGKYIFPQDEGYVIVSSN
jgi:hypothetical protein